MARVGRRAPSVVAVNFKKENKKNKEVSKEKNKRKKRKRAREREKKQERKKRPKERARIVRRLVTKSSNIDRTTTSNVSPQYFSFNDLYLCTYLYMSRIHHRESRFTLSRKNRANVRTENDAFVIYLVRSCAFIERKENKRRGKREGKKERVKRKKENEPTNENDGTIKKKKK